MKASYWLPIVFAGLMVERYFDLLLDRLMAELIRTALREGWYGLPLDLLEIVVYLLTPDSLLWTALLLASSVAGLGSALARRRRYRG
ncbi:MAG: hypothetical protein OXL97_12365 [Chloroflexota bacterium]|nr:hypothetical protein [Chloroflexota bacterium]MDE2883873.1 hypothetical protein [Chloroflexota bacterium]